MNVADSHEHLQDWAQKSEGWLNLLLGVISFYGGGDDDNPEALRANGVSLRDHSHVDI